MSVQDQRAAVGFPESGPGEQGAPRAQLPWQEALGMEHKEARGAQGLWPSLSAWHGVGHFCFKAKGWREVGKGDSVTLIPRLVAELVCCEAEGDRRGHAGRGGSRWHLPATRS